MKEMKLNAKGWHGKKDDEDVWCESVVGERKK
jgi:hypothetical protein